MISKLTRSLICLLRTILACNYKTLREERKWGLPSAKETISESLCDVILLLRQERIGQRQECQGDHGGYRDISKISFIRSARRQPISMYQQIQYYLSSVFCTSPNFRSRTMDGYDLKFVLVRSDDEAMSDADIVCTCTTSCTPVSCGGGLRPGHMLMTQACTRRIDKK